MEHVHIPVHVHACTCTCTYNVPFSHAVFKTMTLLGMEVIASVLLSPLFSMLFCNYECLVSSPLFFPSLCSGCLALAELGRRGLLLPQRLKDGTHVHVYYMYVHVHVLAYCICRIVGYFSRGIFLAYFTFRFKWRKFNGRTFYWLKIYLVKFSRHVLRSPHELVSVGGKLEERWLYCAMCRSSHVTVSSPILHASFFGK